MVDNNDGWYYSTNGQVFGPVSLHQIHLLVRSGELALRNSVRHVSWVQWFTVEQASAQLRLSPPGPPAAAPPLPMSPIAAGPAANVVASVSSAQRATSWIIDTVALGLFALAASAALPAVLAAFVQFAAFVGYMVWLPSKGFARLGHVVVGLRIVRSGDDAQPLDTLALATRAATLLLLAAPCLVGAVLSTISMFAHDRAQAWHDVASGTTVVKVKPWDFGRVAP